MTKVCITYIQLSTIPPTSQPHPSTAQTALVVHEGEVAIQPNFTSTIRYTQLTIPNVFWVLQPCYLACYGLEHTRPKFFGHPTTADFSTPLIHQYWELEQTEVYGILRVTTTNRICN